MANNNNDIEIKVKVDTSDVDKSFKDLEKTSSKTADKVSKDADKMEKGYEEVQRQVQSVQRAFNQINTSGISTALNKVQNQVKTVMSNVRNTIAKSLNMDVQLNVNAKTTTSKEDGASQGSSSTNGATMGMLTGASAGAMLQKDLSIIKELPKAFKDSQLSLSEFNREAKKLSNQKKVLDANTQAWEEYRQTILEATGDDIGDYAHAIEQQMKIVQNCLRNASTESRKSIVDLVRNLENLQNTLNIGGNTKLSKELDHLIKQYRSLNIMSGRNSGRKNAPINEQSTATVNKLLEKTQTTLSSVGGLTTRLFNMSSTDKAIVQYGKVLKTFESLKQPINNVKNALSSLGKTRVGKVFTELSSSARQYIPPIINKVKELSNKVKDYVTNIRKASKETKNSTSSMKGAFKSLLSTALPMLSIVGIFNTVKNAITNGMEAIETQNMYDVVFGDSASQMNDFISDVNKTMGLGITDTKRYTATIMQMGKAMGLTSQDAMEMSQTMATMAGDMSSFYNVDLAQAQQDLQSALSGSNEVKVIA